MNKYAGAAWRSRQGQSGVVHGLIPGRAKKIVSITAWSILLHLTCGAGAVDDKDFTVSSDQGNACPTVCTPHPGHHGRTVWYVE